MLSDGFEQRYLLDNRDMDQIHREFVDMVNALESADKAPFTDGYAQLIAHTEATFAAEYTTMRNTAFPALREHHDEHQRMLGELQRFGSKVADDMLALLFVVNIEQASQV